jgi:ATP-binding cassette subfamily C protein LapB
MKLHTLSPLIMQTARLAGQSVQRERLDDIENALASTQASDAADALVRRAWSAANLSGLPSRLTAPRPKDCPFIGWHATDGWFVVVSKSADGSWQVQNSQGSLAWIANLREVECVSLPAKAESGVRASPKASHIVWQAIWQRKGIFMEALLATLLVNMLALAASMFSMQVYDRVIPNRGYQTLWVLSAGAIAALLLELMLKHVRSHAIDRTAARIDMQLSEWFFERALGIRLENRPASVGTLAAQIKGFESVRGIMSSTSIFMLSDVPFALFFIAMIAMIGGWMVLVPLVLLPISMITGLMFKRQIARHTRENQGQSNRKAGLLVESIDGAESFKANSAEWKLQTRWSQLVDAAAESDYQIKHLSALSQHTTVSLQQAGYIALVAMGAYLVSENQLTMGALIACTIINGRALSPIAQLPGLMVQWEHARAAIDGLDKLIALPNEIDDRAEGLTPGPSDGALHLEKATFSYGVASDVAFEVADLRIRAGERLGVIGSIGSGKSTLLKLASGLYRPVGGKVFLDGLDMAMVSPGYLRETIAYLPQDIRLVSGTLRDNVLQGLPDPGDEALLQAARESGLIALIAHHPKGLALPISEGGRGISGGQKQLVALTRLLLARPAVLLLDEPTASMDAAAEANVVATLQAKTAAGATLLVATHKSALLQIVDRLLVMQGGRLVLDGPRDLVLAKLAGGQTVTPITSHRDSVAQAHA